MRGWLVVPAVMVGLCAAPAMPSAFADVARSPLVAHTEWVRYSAGADLFSLRVYPTLSGRTLAGQLDAGALGEDAWNEVLASAPDADTPGMREQFLCHWRYAEFARPGKVSWNLEPWRPVVDEATMLDTGCNPGGYEEAI